ncbi:MAG TPA: polyprenol phosphomannose-dependent alpha 1,6 mannosyltransferase MptB [Solirubrobacteraceae bacterium]|nr:polyprenol phosphomannose-dependent alpha 1,6 mannosyltransferase MptB [Solirubrobacteraceae bacterium]
MPRITDRSLWAWAALGLVGSVLIALAGPHVAGGPVRWWFDPSLGVAAFYVGIAALSVAWLALGRLAIGTRQVWIVAAAWCLPLLLTAPLFSQDVYSYLAQGTIVHLGLDPYRDAPTVLAQHGQTHVLNAVSPFWRHTTAPYGPLFLWIVSWFSGTSPVVGVLLIRVLELVGFVLLAVFVPRLARALGADPGRAAWLVLLSPLVLLMLVAAGHNDLLMIGLLVAGVALAIERRVLAGVALCALAATIKLPAAAAIPFILVALAPDRRTVWRALLVTAGVVLAVSLVSGLGLGWISTTVFSTPSKVRLAITPATALGWTVAQVVPVGARGLESALAAVAFGLSVVLALALLWRVRRETLVRYLGVALVAVAIAGPAAWPWYLTWGLVLLAACREVQRSRALVVALIAAALVVKADGILVFPLHTAPGFVVLYLALAAVAFVALRRPASAGRGRWRARAVAES